MQESQLFILPTSQGTAEHAQLESQGRTSDVEKNIKIQFDTSLTSLLWAKQDRVLQMDRGRRKEKDRNSLKHKHITRVQIGFFELFQHLSLSLCYSRDKRLLETIKYVSGFCS